mmetsp:Transcript_34944/g.80476  ORF Transcript_34944/g.80476 Transcript_34944/m.80476 type:complete len:285 (-) Transcript_34944:275-1129(-)
MQSAFAPFVWALVLCLLRKAEVFAYDLVFYHHYPANVSICFHYGLSSELAFSVGPLSFKETGYASIPEESGSSTSFVYVDASLSSEDCSGWSSLVGGTQRAPLLESASNIFGVTANPADMMAAVLVAYRAEGSSPTVTVDEAILRFSNEAYGFSRCLGEIVSGASRSMVGQLQPGSGKQVVFSCNSAEPGPVSLTFNCDGQVFTFDTDVVGLGSVVCPLSTLQVSLVGRAGVNDTFAPVVKLVSGSQCSCAKRCQPSCAVASSCKELVSGFVVVLLLLSVVSED